MCFPDFLLEGKEFDAVAGNVDVAAGDHNSGGDRQRLERITGGGDGNDAQGGNFPTGVLQTINEILGDMRRTDTGIDADGDGPLLAMFVKKKSESPTDVEAKLRCKKAGGRTTDTGGPKK